ncbi:ATP-binding protein [Salmonella enterica]|nr:ATP-binding protein [Salmonella enterica]
MAIFAGKQAEAKDMGAYVNPGDRSLTIALNDEIYIDKSMILTVLNKKFDTEGRFMCVSRPRRFGKTTVGDLISAYYTRGADSRAMFERLKIARTPGWDARLNKMNVIKIDLGSFFSRYQQGGNVIAKLNELVVKDMRKEFPEADISGDAPIAEAIVDVFSETQTPFVVIIDEYDVMVRERVSQKEFASYLSLLNDLFKSTACGRAIGLAYITGIIPIVRDRVQSKLNNFTEYTMLQPQELAPYIGFTLPEVKALCKSHKMSYKECLRWYDGYHIAPRVSICNSNSVCRAMRAGKFDDYWSKTGAYAAINDYIRMDFDGVKEDISTMIGGGSVPVTVGSFTNVLSDLGDKDKVFTYLIHLGYLTYDERTRTCRIPNGEIRTEWRNAVEDMRDMSPVFEMIRNSEDLLEATLQRDEQAVADALDKAHRYVTSAKNYNNEGALQSAVGLAYFSATSRYDIKKEVAAGPGFADIALKPYVKGAPGIIIELKMDQDPEVGLAQIKEKGYMDALDRYRGPVYLVAVSYGKETKKHVCRIEVIEKR